MRLLIYCLSILFAYGLSTNGRAEEHLDPGIVARHAVADIDQGVLAEQYRHVRMELFKARMELEMTRLKMRRAPEQEQDRIGEALAVQEDRVALLKESTAQIREELIGAIMERLELEARIDHPDDGHSGFEGSWSGHDREGEVVHVRIGGDHARLEAESANEWFETEFLAEARDDGLWNVAFRVIECSNGDYEGKTSLGIAKLDDGHLVVALAEPGTDVRPASPDGSGEKAKVLHLERD